MAREFGMNYWQPLSIFKKKKFQCERSQFILGKKGLISKLIYYVYLININNRNLLAYFFFFSIENLNFSKSI
jgi:hypothetical protein